MNGHQQSGREKALVDVLAKLEHLGFSEDSARASLVPQIGSNYWRHSETRSFDQGEMFYTVEILLSRGEPDIRGYTARLLPADGGPERSYYFPYSGDFRDISLRGAYNLLCGRSVVTFFLASQSDRSTVFHPKWNVLKDDEMKQLPDFEINDQLRNLPLRHGLGTDDGYRIILGLLTGDRVEVALLTAQGEVVAWLEADPVNRGLKLTGKDGRLLDLQSLLLPPASIEGSKKNTSINLLNRKGKRPKGPKR